MNESNAILAQRFCEERFCEERFCEERFHAGHSSTHGENAFTTIFGRHHSLVFGVCMRMLRHQQDAEDVTQETFSRLATYLHRWDPSRPLEPWLITIAGNRCRTLLEKRRLHQPLTPCVEPITQEAEDRDAADSLREELELALTQIPEPQRQAFHLFHQCSMSYADIAKEMECPVGTAKTRVHRARSAVIIQLQQREVVSKKVEEIR